MRPVLLLLTLIAALAGCGDRPAEKVQVAPAPLGFARAAADPLEHGERLSRVLGCSGCHGEDLTGENWSEPGFGSLWTANLTRAVPRYSDAQLALAITSGRRPDGSEMWEMPSHLFTKLTHDDMSALIAWLRSRPPSGDVHPGPMFEEGARREIAAGLFRSSPAVVRAEGESWPPDAVGTDHRRARYIVRATCAECHGMDLRGGRPGPEAVRRPDLRMAAAYPLEDFRRLLRTGIAVGNREVSLMSEVARGRYRHLTDAEIDAVHAYLVAIGQP